MYNRCKSCNESNQNKIMKPKAKPENMCNNDEKCTCGFENDPTVFPENYMYGQSYVPIQYIDQIFKPEAGLKMGTIFPELVSPYIPCQNMEEIAYLRKRTMNQGQCPRANQ